MVRSRVQPKIQPAREYPKEEILARCKELGPAAVQQLMLVGGLPPAWDCAILEWLGEQGVRPT